MSDVLGASCTVCDGDLHPSMEMVSHPSGVGMVPVWLHVNHADWALDPHAASPKEFGT